MSLPDACTRYMHRIMHHMIARKSCILVRGFECVAKHERPAVLWPRKGRAAMNPRGLSPGSSAPAAILASSLPIRPGCPFCNSYRCLSICKARGLHAKSRVSRTHIGSSRLHPLQTLQCQESSLNCICQAERLGAHGKIPSGCRKLGRTCLSTCDGFYNSRKWMEGAPRAAVPCIA